MVLHKTKFSSEIFKIYSFPTLLCILSLFCSKNDTPLALCFVFEENIGYKEILLPHACGY